MAPKTKVDPIAQARTRQYEFEQRIKFITNTAGYTALSLIAALLLMLIGGPTFDPVLNLIGLHSIFTTEGGVYADCSKKENRNNRFCSGSAEPADESWKTIQHSSGGKAVPFNLAH